MSFVRRPRASYEHDGKSFMTIFLLHSPPEDKAVKLVVCEKSYPRNPEVMSSIDNDIESTNKRRLRRRQQAHDKSFFLFDSHARRSFQDSGRSSPQLWFSAREEKRLYSWMKMCFPQLLLKLNRFSFFFFLYRATTKHNVFIEAGKSGAISEAILLFLVDGYWIAFHTIFQHICESISSPVSHIMFANL